MDVPKVERGIRMSGFLICGGLLVQLLTLQWAHPLSFVLFLAAGCPLVLGGIVVYGLTLISVATVEPSFESGDTPPPQSAAAP